MRLGYQLVIAAQNFSREKNAPVLILTLSKDMDEQLKLAEKLVDLVDRENKRFVWLRCSTMPEISNAQVRVFDREKNEKFQQNVYVNYIFVEIIYLLDVTIFVYDEVFNNKPTCIVL